MIQTFFNSFYPIFQAILMIFLIALAAGLLVRQKVVKQEQIDGVSRLTIYIFLPCLIFSKLTIYFNPADMTLWWLLPLVGVIMILVGMGISWIFFIKELPAKKNLIALSSIQNAAYLALPLAEAIYPDQFDQFSVYVFLIVIGVNPMLWSIGKILTSDAPDSIKLKLKDFITPPLVANLLAIFLVLTHLHHFIPALLSESIDFLGQATVPVVTFILGATLGSISLRLWPSFWDALRLLLVKFGFIPLLMLMGLTWLELHAQNQLLAEFFMIQAASAPATGIILQVRGYGGDMQKTGSMMILAYFTCLVAIPLWITLIRLL
ncbi:MAG: AEC family transporter [Candidatus Cyclobacteriaceae bacterium M3_2C_046]